MTIMQMKYFITVAKSLSFTKAAELLFISQPALSRHIKNMEEELNLQLFVRTNTGIKLTPAGSNLLTGFEKIYQEFNDVVGVSKKIQQGMMGTLVVGILEKTDTSDFLAPIYQYFAQKHPNVSLVFREGSFKYLLDELYAGNMDMIFTIKFEVERKESIVYQYVAHSKDHIVMSKFHPLAQKEQVTLDDLKDETFVMISREDNPESSDLIHSICREHGFVPQVHYAQTLSEQVLWITSGMGVSILDTRCELKLNDNVKFYEMESNWDPSLVIAWHQNNYNPLIAEFLKKLNEVMDIEGEDLHVGE
ncbi:MAG: LysR family transcriptional regulator [Eubacterium sp.]|nr:LysR family transcriptional regulator [Eubacterium sp.]